MSVKSADCIIFDAMATIQVLPLTTQTLKISFDDMANNSCITIYNAADILNQLFKVALTGTRKTASDFRLDRNMVTQAHLSNKSYTERMEECFS